MLTASKVLVTGGVMTGTSVVTAIQQLRNTVYFSVQCAWVGAATGVFKIQATNDESVTSTTIWTDLSTTSGPLTLSGSQPAGSDGSLMLCTNATCAPWTFFQLVYTNATSTGTFNATMCSKGA